MLTPKKKPTIRLKNRNLQPNGKIKGVGKSHVPNPPYHKKHGRKAKGRYTKNNN
jgi:hypothetical protein